jgi:hypothetical protein
LPPLLLSNSAPDFKNSDDEEEDTAQLGRSDRKRSSPPSLSFTSNPSSHLSTSSSNGSQTKEYYSSEALGNPPKKAKTVEKKQPKSALSKLLGVPEMRWG